MTLDRVVQEVQAAVEAIDWPRVVHLLGLHWSILLDEATDLLDSTLRVTPLSEFKGNPAASAVRDIRLHAAADTADQMLGKVSTTHLTDASWFGPIARSDHALPLLGAVASRMIALRVRGEMSRAVELAALVENLGRAAAVHNPELIGPRLPAALLQAGITRGLADDLAGATITLHDAYERAPQSRVEYVARDAAGKLALFLALAGDIDHARTWLETADTAPQAHGWYRQRIALTMNTAKTLIAVESLDSETADATVRLLNHSVNTEQGWGPAVTYAQTRYALVWGDRRGALKSVQQDRDRYADWLHVGTTMGPLLAQAEAELRLSLGQTHRVLPVIADYADHPVGEVVRGRLAFTDSDFAAALRLANAALSSAFSSRIRAEALALLVLVRFYLQDDDLRRACEELDATIDATGMTSARYTVHEEVRKEIGAGHEHPPHRTIRTLFPKPEDIIRLSSRQRLVLDQLSLGLTLTEIAETQHLSYNTIKTHSQALYRRLGATSADEAVARAYDAGLLSD